MLIGDEGILITYTDHDLSKPFLNCYNEYLCRIIDEFIYISLFSTVKLGLVGSFQMMEWIHFVCWEHTAKGWENSII